MLIKYKFANIISHSVGCLSLSSSVLRRTKGFSFNGDNYFSFVACAVGVISKNPLPNPKTHRFSPMSSSESFTPLVLTLRSLIHLGLTFVYGMK